MTTLHYILFARDDKPPATYDHTHQGVNDIITTRTYPPATYDHTHQRSTTLLQPAHTRPPHMITVLTQFTRYTHTQLTRCHPQFSRLSLHLTRYTLQKTGLSHARTAQESPQTLILLGIIRVQERCSRCQQVSRCAMNRGLPSHLS